MSENEASKQDYFEPARVSAENVGACSFVTVAPTVVNTTAPVVGKIPVVLQEITVQIDVLANITLDERAIEIKRVKNRLKLVQCRLLQPTGKLFLRGFVRQNIEYAAEPKEVTPTTACGDILDCIVDIPFECLTDITTFINPPVFGGFNSSNEFEYFKSTRLPHQFPEKERLLAGDLSEFNQQTVESFTEIPFCELLSTRITHFLEFIHREPIRHGPFEERTFHRIEEKIDIELTLKILQNQQVCVAASTSCP
ncbi:MAG TPA: hypothetical protein VMW83_13220 [Spirochaetia bacterium]|nr:hypothetical protein [Spirochaetia bacterium]